MSWLAWLCIGLGLALVAVCVFAYIVCSATDPVLRVAASVATLLIDPDRREGASRDKR